MHSYYLALVIAGRNVRYRHGSKGLQLVATRVLRLLGVDTRPSPPPLSSPHPVRRGIIVRRRLATMAIRRSGM